MKKVAFHFRSGKVRYIDWNLIFQNDTTDEQAYEKLTSSIDNGMWGGSGESGIIANFNNVEFLEFINIPENIREAEVML